MRNSVESGYIACLLAALLLLLCVTARGQSVNPAQDEFRLNVDAFVLVAAEEALLHHRLSSLRKQLVLERARFGDTMSVDELHQVADALTGYIRNLGFVFHTVYLPPQTVEDGLVEFRLRQGVLGSVHVINNTSLSDQRIADIFDGQLGEVLYGPEIEERVQALKAQGGFDVFPFYSRGVAPGEARLNLRVDESRKRSFALRVDNYGSASSGEHRLIAQYTEFQLTGHHDRLSLAVLRSLDDIPNTYGSIGYNLPFSSLQYAWDISASNNQFEVGDRFAALGLQGAASTVATGITHHLKHHPKHRSRVRLGFYERRTNLDMGDAAAPTEIAREMSRTVSLQWVKDNQWPTSGAALNITAEIGHGEYEVKDAPDGTFSKFNVGAFWVKGTGSGRLRNLVQLSLHGQYSDVALPSLEGFSLTGAYGVRGFEAGGFSADRAFLSALEWRLPALLSFSGEQRWRLEPYVLGDWATGTKKGMGEGDAQDATFGSAGVGLRMNWGQHFSAQVTASKALKGEVDGNEVEGNEQILFEIRWF